MSISRFNRETVKREKKQPFIIYQKLNSMVQKEERENEYVLNRDMEKKFGQM